MTPQVGVSSTIAKGASLLVVLQLSSRITTFIANQVLLRYITAPLLGQTTQLEVYYLTVLFFSRESLRVAIQRQGAPSPMFVTTRPRTKGNERDGMDPSSIARESQAVINLGYVAISTGIVIAIMLGHVYLNWLVTLSASHPVPCLKVSLYLYGIASILELLSEPCFAVMQISLQFRTRAIAESIASLLRCAAVVLTAAGAPRWLGVKPGVLPFALGQTVYGAALLVVYLLSGRKMSAARGFSLFPRKMHQDDEHEGDGGASQFVAFGYLYKPTISLATSMMAQNVVKNLLTQGDTFLVSVFSTPQVQGTYALANNYGGLLARILFQPIEESSRTYFSRLLVNDPSAGSHPPLSDRKGAQDDVQDNLRKARKDLQILLRLYILLSLPIIVFGPPAASPILRIVAGSHWASTASSVLSLYAALYIPLLGLNGLTESFVASVASSRQVHIQSLFMSAFSVLFGVAAWFFMVRMGFAGRGLVMANALNMTLRTCWSTYFVQQYFKARHLPFLNLSMVPKSAMVMGWTTVKVMDWMDLTVEANPVETLIKLTAIAVPFVVSIAFTERELIADLLAPVMRLPASWSRRAPTDEGQCMEAERQMINQTLS